MKFNLHILLIFGFLAAICAPVMAKLDLETPSHAPAQPTLYLPLNGTEIDDDTPYFEWENVSNADNYRLLVDNDSDFSSPEENRIVLENTYTIATENSLPDDNYSWKVVAINEWGENESETWTFVVSTAVGMLISLAAFVVVSAGAVVLSIAISSFMHYKRRWSWSRVSLVCSPITAAVVIAAYLLLIF